MSVRCLLKGLMATCDCQCLLTVSRFVICSVFVTLNCFRVTGINPKRMTWTKIGDSLANMIMVKSVDVGY